MVLAGEQVFYRSLSLAVASFISFPAASNGFRCRLCCSRVRQTCSTVAYGGMARELTKGCIVIQVPYQRFFHVVGGSIGVGRGQDTPGQDTG